MKVIATRPEPQRAAPEAPAPAPAFVALVVAAQGGDRAAFAQLYDQFEPTVRGIALARVSPGDARDVLHDVFVTVLTRLPSLRAPLAFPTWLASIARNRSIDVARKSSKIREADESALGVVSLDERALGLLAKIQELPQGFAELLVLRFVEGMTGPEIAERLGLADGYVRVKLNRGLNLLRRRLGEGGDRGR
ncbi:MAG: sigma-70 family RNA polymerase sigma factor [Myxococcales bacterium]|nr:sigma-70 family RNA polymerase sigma factor [Myxococcales bacterium]